jgi:hypothetical protein
VRGLLDMDRILARLGIGGEEERVDHGLIVNGQASETKDGRTY